jgi:hypothetical protein
MTLYTDISFSEALSIVLQPLGWTVLPFHRGQKLNEGEWVCLSVESDEAPGRREGLTRARSLLEEFPHCRILLCGLDWAESLRRLPEGVVVDYPSVRYLRLPCQIDILKEFLEKSAPIPTQEVGKGLLQLSRRDRAREIRRLRHNLNNVIRRAEEVSSNGGASAVEYASNTGETLIERVAGNMMLLRRLAPGVFADDCLVDTLKFWIERPDNRKWGDAFRMALDEFRQKVEQVIHEWGGYS